MYSIYQITNNCTGRSYIGKTCEYKHRFKQHLTLLKQGKHHSKLMQHDFDKYGERSLQLDLIEEVESAHRAKFVERDAIVSLGAIYNTIY